METFIPILMIGGFFAIGAGIVYFAMKYETKKRAEVASQYQVLAEKFGLDFVPEVKKLLWNYTYPMVVGQIDGFDIKLYSYLTGGKNKTRYTQLIIHSNSIIPNFRILKEGIFQKIGKKFGGQDIEIGDDLLDREMVFKCDEPDRLKTALHPDNRQLLTFLSPRLAGALQVKNSTFTYQKINHIDTEEERKTMESILVFAIKVMKEMGDSR